MKDLTRATKTWLEYGDSDRFDEDKARELTKARIEIREALRKGYRLVDLKKLEKRIANYETNCLVSHCDEEECLRCAEKIFKEIRKFIQESTE